MSRDIDIAAFIRQNLDRLPAPSVPEVMLYSAHPGSGLSRLESDDPGAPPYWAYRWAGGTVLARYILDRPQTVADRHVLDLGTGSGLVAIAAAKCGARCVTAVDIDPVAIVAAGINAQANDVDVRVLCIDMLGGAVPDAEIILVGDLFYDAALAARVLAFLERCRQAHIDILIGDPGRAPLPVAALVPIAEYPTGDFGDGRGSIERPAVVYRLR
jgi:predicted nicotinamide N-methyase